MSNQQEEILTYRISIEHKRKGEWKHLCYTTWQLLGEFNESQVEQAEAFTNRVIRRGPTPQQFRTKRITVTNNADK